MAGVVFSQWIRHCMHQFMFFCLWHRIWRRKPIVLAVILVSTLFLLVIQYSTGFTGSTNQKRTGNGKFHHSGDVAEFRSFNDKYRQIQSEKDPNRVNNGESSDKKEEYGIFDVQKPPQVLGHNPESIVRPNQPIIHEQKSLSSLSKNRYIPSFRFVHLDLKGAPPKISYFKQVFPLMSESGANGILLEYEDMFPFEGLLKPGAAGNAYSRDDIKELLDLAKVNNFEVIPLVQTFGHLELFLKLPEFRHLREVDDYPQAICPSKNDSFSLVTQIIDQVMVMHPTTKWLHIGCDEVYHLGYCEKCRYKDRDSLFLNHVARVAKYVRDKHHVIPIIWDDLLRQIPSEKIKESFKDLNVEIMIWTYIKDIYRFIPYSQWISFGEVFPHVWAASAFKGAFGETLTVPNVKMHLENNEAWIEVLSEQSKNFKSIRGIVITGWQRYDHFGTLCELLPAAMPSLIVNLLITSEGAFDPKTIFKKFDKIMGCASSHSVNSYYGSYSKPDVDLDNDPYLFSHTSNCFFPGSAVYRMIQHHSDAIKRVNDYLYDVTIHKAWLTDYNVRHNISSPFRVDEGLQEYSSVYYTLQSILRTAKEALKEVYDDYTVSEWIEQNIYPYLLKMEKLMENGVRLKKAKTWPKRPLPLLEDLKRFINGNENNNNYNHNNDNGNGNGNGNGNNNNGNGNNNNDNNNHAPGV